MTYIPHRRREDNFFVRVMTYLKRFFMVIGISVTISAIVMAFSVSRAMNAAPKAADNMILTYTFKAGLMESVTKPSLAQPLLGPAETFHEIITALANATKDSRVKGFVARLQNVEMSPAQIQELRDTLAKFRAKGKFAHVFAEDFGGFSPGMGDYYLASAFNQIWLQPVGAVSINGISAEVPFLRGTLDKIGVSADFSHKGKYKSASESLTEKGMSDPHREMITVLVDDLAGQIVAGIAADRKMKAEEVKNLIDRAPYSDDEALKLKLVDKLGYYSQMLDEAKKKAGKDAEEVELRDYSVFADKTEVDFERGENKAKIALIVGEGEIVPYGRETRAGLRGDDMYADKIVEAFEDARKDKDVVAVVFRIDSPGGSPGASESIRHALIETQKKGKPVIVSMGGYAASGGYWIATPADKIVAEPATITGSIGVFGGKFVLAQLWEKIGLGWEGVQFGENASMWSANKLFSEKEKARFEFLLGKTYDDFIVRVMEGRKMTREQAMAVAEGRVWTGKQAKERGLVDELGGVDKAVILAKIAAKRKADEDLPIQRFPEPKSMLELFFELATEGVAIQPVISLSVNDVLQSLNANANMLNYPRLVH